MHFSHLVKSFPPGLLRVWRCKRDTCPPPLPDPKSVFCNINERLLNTCCSKGNKLASVYGGNKMIKKLCVKRPFKPSITGAPKMLGDEQRCPLQPCRGGKKGSRAILSKFKSSLSDRVYTRTKVCMAALCSDTKLQRARSKSFLQLTSTCQK